MSIFLSQKLSQSFFFLIEEYHFRGMLFVIDIFWKIKFFRHFTHFTYFLKWCRFLSAEFRDMKMTYGHFWSIVLRIWCGTWNSNLESYLIHIIHTRASFSWCIQLFLFYNPRSQTYFFTYKSLVCISHLKNELKQLKAL